MEKELSFREALRALKGMEIYHIVPVNVIEDYDRTEEIICRWLDEHPLKTRKQEFLEKFPNAKLLNDGTPNVCCEDIGYNEDAENCKGMCEDCWNKLIDD
jgi:hypothetical protein